MTDGSLIFSTDLDNKQLEKKLSELKKKIAKSTSDLQKKETEQSGLKRELDEAKNSALETENAIKRLKAEQESLKASTSAGSTVNLSPEKYIEAVERQNEISAELKEQESILARQDKETERIAKNYTKCTDKVIEITENLQAQEEDAGAVIKQLEGMNNQVDFMAPAMARAEKNLGRFTRRIKSLARRVFVFTIILQAFRAMKEWFEKVAATDEKASSAVARFKGELLTLAQPIVEVLIPAFTILVDVVTRVITAISGFVSMVSGTTIEKSRAAAKALNAQTEALDGTGEAAENAEKALAGFDEINKLASGGESGSAGVSGSSGSPDFSGMSGLDTEEYKNKVDALTVYLSGALLAIGAILAFSGANIPLGLGMMAVGAITLASEIKENWSAMDGPVGRAITSVVTILGGASFAIGALLLLSGANVPLGLGLLAVGAASLCSAAVLNWRTMGPKVQNAVAGILTILGTASLAIGAVLAFSGVNIPLGVGLMLAGATSLGTAAVLNWDAIKQKLKDKSFSGAMAAIGSALLVFGALFAFTGTNIPLGVGLMLAGAASLGTAAALNWDAIKEKLRDKSFAGVMAAIGISLLVLGAVLAFTGVNIPLGVGLMLGGAASLGTVVALNWDAILEKLKESFGKIQSWWGSSVEPKLTLSFWKDKFKNIQKALVSKIKDAVNGGIDLFNRFIGWVNDKLNITWDAVEIAGHEIIPAGSFQLFSIPQIPRLATGAVIPPNREFMAILGDQKSGVNVEAPESLLRQMANDAAGMNTGLLQKILDAILSGKIMVVDSTAFAKVVYAANKSEANRHGTSLVVR